MKDNVGLAMRRLSIIDLARAGSSRSATRTVRNGSSTTARSTTTGSCATGSRNADIRFYTNSDTEAIFIFTTNTARTVLSIFAGCSPLRSGTNGKIAFLARDRVGKKPLLYSHQPNGDLIFGSEFTGACLSIRRFRATSTTRRSTVISRIYACRHR